MDRHGKAHFYSVSCRAGPSPGSHQPGRDDPVHWQHCPRSPFGVTGMAGRSRSAAAAAGSNLQIYGSDPAEQACLKNPEPNVLC
jgi:hypothetical protein